MLNCGQFLSRPPAADKSTLITMTSNISSLAGLIWSVADLDAVAKEIMQLLAEVHS
ncbi:hypothetical protein GCM10022421_13620 [Oceanisphaera sediminis]|uniref:Uncharacterized protein n=1 Tax=Oceanisphaera sediminis TaxID=981381 RepID=A0ABP7DR76_9GAMM